MPIDSLAEPFVGASGIRVPADVPEAVRHHAETAARSFLTAQVENLRDQGFQDPAAILFKAPDGDVGFVVIDTHSRLAGSKAKALFPEGAESLGRPVYLPSGYD
ncbi:MAG: hypothetical protein KJ017_13335 [Alphaproteobacteria bacterium]|nr:hypothetical protein [Alphaproteobacteria bacterium]